MGVVSPRIASIGVRVGVNDDTLLFRQIHPSWVKEDRITRQAFTPTPKDEAKLSVYDGEQITAEGSWCHYAQECGYPSKGVMAVTVGECAAYGREVVLDSVPYREHAYIDFAGLSRSKAKNVGKALAQSANKRGWQYRPDPA